MKITCQVKSTINDNPWGEIQTALVSFFAVRTRSLKIASQRRRWRAPESPNEDE